MSTFVSKTIEVEVQVCEAPMSGLASIEHIETGCVIPKTCANPMAFACCRLRDVSSKGRRRREDTNRTYVQAKEAHSKNRIGIRQLVHR